MCMRHVVTQCVACNEGSAQATRQHGLSPEELNSSGRRTENCATRLRAFLSDFASLEFVRCSAIREGSAGYLERPFLALLSMRELWRPICSPPWCVLRELGDKLGDRRDG